LLKSSAETSWLTAYHELQAKVEVLLIDLANAVMDDSPKSLCKRPRLTRSLSLPLCLPRCRVFIS
jgi:hypothetical protein